MARAIHLSRQRPVLAFFALALLLSWAFWIPMILAGERVAPGSPATHLPGLAGPLLAALIVTRVADGQPGLARFACAILDPRGIRPLLWLAAVAPIGVALLAAAAAGSRAPVAHWLAVPGVPAHWPPLAALLIVLLAVGIGEEAGWRGFAFLRLLPGGRIRAALIVGALWMAWHAPLFWLNAGMQALLGPMLVGWVLALLAGSLLLGWLTLAAGGRLWPASLFHATMDMATATPPAAGVPAMLVSSLVMLAGAAVALAWRRERP